MLSPFSALLFPSRQLLGQMIRKTTYNNENFFGVILEEVAVELVDATDPGEHNSDIVADLEATGLASRTTTLDDSTSQANVSIRNRGRRIKNERKA